MPITGIVILVILVLVVLAIVFGVRHKTLLTVAFSVSAAVALFLLVAWKVVTRRKESANVDRKGEMEYFPQTFRGKPDDYLRIHDPKAYKLWQRYNEITRRVHGHIEQWNLPANQDEKGIGLAADSVLASFSLYDVVMANPYRGQGFHPDFSSRVIDEIERRNPKGWERAEKVWFKDANALARMDNAARNAAEELYYQGAQWTVQQI